MKPADDWALHDTQRHLDRAAGIAPHVPRDYPRVLRAQRVTRRRRSFADGVAFTMGVVLVVVAFGTLLRWALS